MPKRRGEVVKWGGYVKGNTTIDCIIHLCSMFNVNMGIMSNDCYKGVGGGWGWIWKTLKKKG